MKLTKDQQKEKQFMRDSAVDDEWIQQWYDTAWEGESLETWTSRRAHEHKMSLMYNMALMLENNPSAVETYQQARTRYQYYKDLYDRQQYEH